MIVEATLQSLWTRVRLPASPPKAPHPEMGWGFFDVDFLFKLTILGVCAKMEADNF